MPDMPSPGETVLKERVIDDGYTRLNVVPDGRWESTDDELTVADDEFVTESRNRMHMLAKYSADEVHRRDDGEWVISRDE